MNDIDNKVSESQYTRGSRILAMITVIIIIALFIAMFVCAIIGSKLYLGFLFAAIIVPCLIYAIVWLRGVLNKAYGRKVIGISAENGKTDNDDAEGVTAKEGQSTEVNDIK